MKVINKDTKIEYVQLTEIQPHPENDNDGDRESIGESIDENGFYGAIYVDSRNGNILRGNNTYLELKAMGETEVPVIWIVPDDDEHAYRILVSDNNIAAKATRDPQKTVAILQKIRRKQGDLKGTSYRQSHLDSMLSQLHATRTTGRPGRGKGEDETRLADMAELKNKWGVEVGQIWEVGKHRIACGDRLDLEYIILPLLDGTNPKLVFADPPYGISAVGTRRGVACVGGGSRYNIPFGGVEKDKKTRGRGKATKKKATKKKAKSKDKAVETAGYTRNPETIEGLAEPNLYMPVIGDETTETAEKAVTLYLEQFPKAAQVWFGANHYSHCLPASPCWLIWDKEQVTKGKGFADAELAWTNQSKAVRIFRHQWSGLMRASERNTKRVHPTQKPVALLDWILGKFSKEGDVVLDPFGGSAPTFVSCLNMGRVARIIELSPDYVAFMLERAADEYGFEPRLI